MTFNGFSASTTHHTIMYAHGLDYIWLCSLSSYAMNALTLSISKIAFFKLHRIGVAHADPLM